MRDSRNAVTLAPFALWDERSRTVGKQKSVYSELSKIALRNPIMTLIYEGAHLTEDGSVTYCELGQCTAAWYFDPVVEAWCRLVVNNVFLVGNQSFWAPKQ